jgi:hypothetical protein
VEDEHSDVNAAPSPASARPTTETAMSTDRTGPAEGAGLARGTTASRDLAVSRVHDVTRWSGLGACVVTATVAVALAPVPAHGSTTTRVVPGRDDGSGQVDNGSAFSGNGTVGGGLGPSTSNSPVVSSGAS